MKITLLGLLLSATVCLTFYSPCVDIPEPNYQGRNHLEKTADKLTDKFEENENSDNKLVDKADEKINKD